ncbi:MAG: hypothetical protein WC644_04790 [Ignavibacteria bacterium]
MARIKYFSTGRISGKVGTLVYFTKNGKSFVRSAGIRKDNPSYNDIVRRQKFGMSTKLAKCINSVPELKALWETHKSAIGSTFNAIQKANYEKVNGKDVLDTPAVIPGLYDSIQTDKAVKFKGQELRFALSEDETHDIYACSLRENAIIAGVLFLNYHDYNSNEPYRFIGLKGNIVKTKKGDTAVIKIGERISSIMKEYSVINFYFGIVSGDKGFGNYMRKISLQITKTLS